MILVFANDATVVAVEDDAQASKYCEGVDVADGVYTFIDEYATVLKPVFTTPNDGASLGPIRMVGSEVFTLVRTKEMRPDLLMAILEGNVSVEAGPRILSREELLRELGKADA